ncbi:MULTISPECIES: protein LphB [unclassified Legionella]|uniref:protein LphB n=1 Tax=unclassified Legionella TaxID=2622702 RepID=UPI001055C32E|nr:MULTISPECIES: protein LphB [unclassified Legionella]MDI9818339.1 protein LphB [Legionella sp. PL877]
MTGKKRVFITLLLVCFCYLLIFQVSAIWPFTIDDMFISLRYAKHWAAGEGLLWNIGEEPVEGYSNFSFVILAALAIRLHLDPVIMLKSFGVLGLVLTAFGLYCLSRLWFAICIAFIPCLWMLLYSGQILWSVSGLETTIYQALICFSLFCLLRGMGYGLFPRGRGEAKWSFFALSGLLFALAGMTRPEAPALMLLFFSLAVFDSPQTARKRYFQGILLGCFTTAVFFLPYFLWRWTYYERLFPNPVYCKGFAGFLLELDLNYLYLAWLFMLLALPAIFRAKDRLHYFFWLPSLVYLILLIGADPVVAFANRLFLPVFILLLPLALKGVCCLLKYWLVKDDGFYYASLLITVFFIALLFIPKLSLADYRYFAINPQAGLQLRQEVVNWLNKNVSQGSRVLLGDSGMIPYLSSLNFIDSYCLNNKEMTKFPPKEMYRRLCGDILLIKPEVIILTSLKEPGRLIYAPADLCLKEKLSTTNMYEFKSIYKTRNQGSSYRYEIYTLSN